MLVGVRGIKERLRKRVISTCSWCPGPGGIKLRKSWVTTHHVTFIFFFFGWYPPRIVRASVVRTGPLHTGGTSGRVPGSRRRRNSRNLRGRHVGIQTRPGESKKSNLQAISCFNQGQLQNCGGANQTS